MNKPAANFLAPLLASLLSAAVLAACADAPGGGGGARPAVSIVPAQVKEPPGPTDASGMGATATPSPTAPAARPASSSGSH